MTPVEGGSPDIVELSERLAQCDAAMVTQALGVIEEAGDGNLRWQFGLLALRRLFEDFQFSLLEQVRLLDATREGLLAEHGNGAKTIKAQVARQYRQKRTAIGRVLDAGGDRSERYGRFDELLDARARATAIDRFELLRLHRNGGLPVPLRALHANYVEMFCNRLFPTDQRLHELALVTFLAKHVRSQLARSG